MFEFEKDRRASVVQLGLDLAEYAQRGLNGWIWDPRAKELYDASGRGYSELPQYVATFKNGLLEGIRQWEAER